MAEPSPQPHFSASPLNTTPSQPHPLPAPAVVEAHSRPADTSLSQKPYDSSSAENKLPNLYHFQKRRFIGPLPESVVNSNEVEEARRWYGRLRRKLNAEESVRSSRRGRRRGEDGGLGGEGEGHLAGVLDVGKHIGKRVRHPLGGGGDNDPDAETDDGYTTDGSHEDRPSAGQTTLTSMFGRLKPGKGKSKAGKSLRPDVWVGESFDIGGQFEGLRKPETRCSRRYGGLIEIDDRYITSSSEDSSAEEEQEEETGHGEGLLVPGGRPTKPKRQTTQATATTMASFHTARTHQPISSPSQLTTATSRTGNEDFFSALSDVPPPSESHQPEGDLTGVIQPSVSAGTGIGGGNGNGEYEASSSKQNLIIPEIGVSYPSDEISPRGSMAPVKSIKIRDRSNSGSLRGKSRALPGKIRSALRKRNQDGDFEDNGVDPRCAIETRSDLHLPLTSTTSKHTPTPPPGEKRRKTKTVQFPASPPADNSIRGFLSGSRRRKSKIGEDGKGKVKGNGVDEVQGFDVDGNNGTGANGDMAEDDPAHSIEPADPGEVLARRGSEVVGTSAGAVQATKQEQMKKRKPPRATKKEDRKIGRRRHLYEEATNTELGINFADYDTPDDEIDTDSDAQDHHGQNYGRKKKNYRDIYQGPVLRDRMLVRIGRNSETGLRVYDEEIARRKPANRLERMQEYLVVYRKGFIELYQEWRLPLKERFVKTKRLAFSIPLDVRFTSFSIYNPLDMSFSLCLDSGRMLSELEGKHNQKKAGKMRQRLKDSEQLKWLQSGKAGHTQIFIFMCREKRRVMDWTWEIWKELGGVLPEVLDISVPDLGSVIKLPRPIEDTIGSRSTCEAVSRSQVLKASIDALKEMPNFDQLVEDAHRSLGEGIRLELAWKRQGWLDWLQSADDIDDHDGSRHRDWALLAGYTLLNTNNPAKLELRAARHGATFMKLADGERLAEPPAIEGYLYRIQTRKGRKVHQQIYLASHGGSIVSSLPSNAETPLPNAHIKVQQTTGDAQLYEAFAKDESGRGSRNILKCTGFVDIRDISVVRGLRRSRKRASSFSRGDKTGSTEGDAAQEHQKRFEIVIGRTGEKVRFEANSAADAREWIQRLSAMHKYWSQRQRTDARERMDVSRSNLRGNDTFVEEHMNDTVDTTLPLHWNWCLIENCGPLTHAGRLFVKKRPRKQFRAQFCAVTDGHLVTFSFGDSAFHRRKQTYCLNEAYVYSGSLAQAELTVMQSEDAFSGEARIYQDGLECADGAEDCAFVLWFRKKEKVVHSHHSHHHRQQQQELDEAYQPPLLGKPAAKIIMFRARSQYERNRWVVALRHEIQYQSRLRFTRTEKVRNDGLVRVKLDLDD